MCEQQFYICKHCGNLCGLIHASGVPMICCGEPMTLLEPGVVEASHEKHLPVITREGSLVTVTVGAVLHPMAEEHYIQWIYLQTTKGGHRKCFAPGDAPALTFALTADEEPVAAFAYCNLHGLWKTSL